MRYVFMVLLVLVLAGSLVFSSCRCMNRAEQSSASQSNAPSSQLDQPDERPDTGSQPDQQGSQSGSSTTQGDTLNTSSPSGSKVPLKINLWITKGTVTAGYVAFATNWSVNQKARVVLSVHYPDGTAYKYDPFVMEEPQTGTQVHVDNDKGTGKGYITLTAEVTGMKETAEIYYTVKVDPSNPNSRVFDYQQVKPTPYQPGY